MKEELSNPNNGDEISLVDVMIILIKRRGIVVVFSLVSLVIGVLGAFLLPALNLAPWFVPETTIEARVQVAQVPSELHSYLPPNLTPLAVDQIKSTSLLANIYKNVYKEKAEELSNENLNGVLKNLLETSLKVQTVANTTLLKISYTGDSKDEDQFFINGILAEAAISIKSLIEPNIATARRTLEESMSTVKAQTELSYDGMMALVSLEKQKNALNAFETSPYFPFQVLEIETISEQMASKAAVFIILFLSGIILGVLTAFLVEGVASSFQDSNLKERLKRAWNQQN